MMASSSSVSPDTSISLVISKLQQVTNPDLIEQCWEMMMSCLRSWLSHCPSSEQQLLCLQEITKLRGYCQNQSTVCRLFGEAALQLGDLIHANEHLSHVIKSSDSRVLDPDLFETVSNIRDNLVVRWSFRMLNDIRRNHAYLSAITSTLAAKQHQRTVVLDLGAGTGLLSLYAASAGATSVIAVEQDEVMCGICRAVTCDAESVRVLHCSSEEFDISSNHVDIVVTETLDSVGIGEGIVTSCRDLATRSLNKHLQFIPSHLAVLGFLVQSDTLLLSHSGDKVRSTVGSPEDPYCCEFVDEFPDLIQLSEPTNIFTITLGKTFKKKVYLIELTVRTSGWCNGMCSYVTAALTTSISITTAPKSINTDAARMECWEQGYHPLPQRYLNQGQSVQLKVELSESTVRIGWIKSDGFCEDAHGVLEQSQIKLLNSELARSPHNELLNVVPKVVDVSGLVISNPFNHEKVVSFSFYGYVVHSKQLLSWSRVTPLALCLKNSRQSEILSSEVNKYRTLIHQNVPWDTLDHTKLTEKLLLLRLSRQAPEVSSNTLQFSPLSPFEPTAVVIWTELEFASGIKFNTETERLWRPAAILLPGEIRTSEGYLLTVCFSGTSLAASITSCTMR